MVDLAVDSADVPIVAVVSATVVRVVDSADDSADVPVVAVVAVVDSPDVAVVAMVDSADFVGIAPVSIDQKWYENAFGELELTTIYLFLCRR